MTVIVNEEKDSIKMDVSRLKKELERREQREDSQLQEAKALREEITKLELKNNALQKEYEKFKIHMTQTITTALSMKNITSDIAPKQLIRSRMKSTPETL